MSDSVNHLHSVSPAFQLSLVGLGFSLSYVSSCVHSQLRLPNPVELGSVAHVTPPVIQGLSSDKHQLHI